MYKIPTIVTDTLIRQLKGNWQAGDWCVEGYEIKQIKEIKNGKVNSLSTGYIESGYHNYNDMIFPLTLATKRIAESVEYEYKRLRPYNGLNFPDLNRKYEEFAREGYELCFKEFKNEEDCNKQFQDFYDKVADFTRQIIEKVKNLEVGGVKLIRN